MKNIAKKLAILSMVGVMQLGLGASVIEASPQYKEPATMQQQQSDRNDQRQDGPQKDRSEKDRQERERIENKRHEQEMKRRPNESEKEWHERQKPEKERHEMELRKVHENR